MKPQQVTVSNRTVVRVILIILATLLALRFISHVGHVLELIFMSFFLSLALSPLVGWFARSLKLKRRIAATAIAYLIVLAMLGTIISIVFPPLIRQTISFVQDAPQTINSLNDENSSLGRVVNRYHLQNAVQGLSENLSQRTKHIQEPVVSTAGRIGSTLISILTILVLTFMMLVEGPAWNTRIWQLVPKKNRAHSEKLASQMYRAVTGYVNGQVLLALIAATFSFVALMIVSSLLNVSINAAGLAGILIFTGLIPLIGHTIGGTIVTLACLFVSLPLAAIMAVYFILYQQIENVTLQPYIQAKYNELTPLLVLSVALLGASFGGLLGAFVAIPAAACVKILLLDYLERRNISTDS